MVMSTDAFRSLNRKNNPTVTVATIHGLLSGARTFGTSELKIHVGLGLDRDWFVRVSRDMVIFVFFVLLYTYHVRLSSFYFYLLELIESSIL